MPEVDKKEARLLLETIAEWKGDGLVSAEQADRMKATVCIRGTDWKLISLYVFIAAISCGLMAFGALILDAKWLEILRKKLSLTDGVISLLFALLSAGLCYLRYRKRPSPGPASFSSEAFWILPVLTIGVCVVYLGKSFDYLHGHPGAFYLLAGVLFAVPAWLQQSRVLWVACLLSTATGFVSETYALSGHQAYFLGMNLPCRLFLFSSLVLLAAVYLRKRKPFSVLQPVSWTMGWLMLLLAAWLVSIFGNTASWEAWEALRQSRFLWWVALFTLLTAGAIWLGIRLKDDTLRDIAIVCMLLNLYTRYFEYFWDRTNKGIFFAILGLSLWIAGKRIEKFKGAKAGNRHSDKQNGKA